jgi:hypothetical protein
MTNTMLTCTDCGKSERAGEIWHTTNHDFARGAGWCPDCTRLRTAQTLCQPTARLRAAQKARRARATA